MSKTIAHRITFGLGLLALVLSCSSGCGGATTYQASPTSDWEESFAVPKGELSDRGSTTYFVLEPGRACEYAHGDATLTISVLDETKLVDGVRTRVVEERETKRGKLVEVSRNYFAIHGRTGDVYYFGEDVDIYKNGKLVGHEGAWLSGVDGARFGLMMPGTPRVGLRYYQEWAPGVAMDRCAIVSVTDRAATPAGEFNDCVRTRESSKIEKGTGEKVYAPSVGLVKDDEFELVRIRTVRP